MIGVLKMSLLSFLLSPLLFFFFSIFFKIIVMAFYTESYKNRVLQLRHIYFILILSLVKKFFIKRFIKIKVHQNTCDTHWGVRFLPKIPFPKYYWCFPFETTCECNSDYRGCLLLTKS